MCSFSRSIFCCVRDPSSKIVIFGTSPKFKQNDLIAPKYITISLAPNIVTTITLEAFSHTIGLVLNIPLQRQLNHLCASFISNAPASTNQHLGNNLQPIVLLQLVSETDAHSP